MAVSLNATYAAKDQSFSFNLPAVTRTEAQGPCKVTLSLDVSGIRQSYYLGSFQTRAPIKGISGIGLAFKYAFDQASLIVSIALCGILGWGNTPVSSNIMRLVTITLSVLLIIPETGVALTFNGYDIRNFYLLSDPIFGISVNQIAFVIVYSALFTLLLSHFITLVLSLPLSVLQRVSNRLLFHRKREASQISYVKALLHDFRWAYKYSAVFQPPRDVSEFSHLKEAKMMIAGIRNNKNAFYFPLRLQVALLISTIAIIPILVVLLQAVYNIRSLVLQTIMPFFQTLFAFVGLAETESWLNNQQSLSQNSAVITRAYSLFFRISSFAEGLIFAVQTSAYIGISFGLLRFVFGQVSLLLVTRSKLLAARKGDFKIDSTISDYCAFSFVGNQIACSLLGFVVVSVLVTLGSFSVILFSVTRDLIFATILAALPVIIFAVLQTVMV